MGMLDILRVRQELSILQELDHPNVVKLYDTFGTMSEDSTAENSTPPQSQYNSIISEDSLK